MTELALALASTAPRVWVLALVFGGWMLDRWSDRSGGRGPGGYRAAFLATAVIVAVALALYTRTREAHGAAHPQESDARSWLVPGVRA